MYLNYNISALVLIIFNVHTPKRHTYHKHTDTFKYYSLFTNRFSRFSLLHLQSLVNWDASKPESLLNLVNELLSLYRKHNLKRAGTITRLQQDLNSLLRLTNLVEDDIELYVTGTEVCHHCNISTGKNIKLSGCFLSEFLINHFRTS